MKIAITGASGQLGRAAVEGLAERVGMANLILISRDPSRLAEFAERGASCRRGDFDDPASLTDAFAGADRMLLISGTRVGKRVAQHRAAIEAAVASGVGHIAYTSFIGISADNPAIIVRDHGPTEDILKSSGAAWTILRDAQYADAVTDVIAPNALATGKWVSSSGDGRMAFVARDDCVACAVAVLAGQGHEGRTYNVTGPELLTYRQAAQIVAEAGGRPVDYVATDDNGLYAMFDAMGVPREPVDDLVVGGNPWCSDDMVTFEAGIRGGHFDVLTDDVERLTGRGPRSLRDLARARLGLQAAK
ncbi:MAG TPA: SDR family oxidoreductase [Caulobacteraceae bacterium]